MREKHTVTCATNHRRVFAHLLTVRTHCDREDKSRDDSADSIISCSRSSSSSYTTINTTATSYPCSCFFFLLTFPLLVVITVVLLFLLFLVCLFLCLSVLILLLLVMLPSRLSFFHAFSVSSSSCSS